MADKNYVVSLTVDDSGAVAAVNQMTTALDKADTSTQSLKAQLRQMQQELQKLDIGSEEFQKLSIEAGKLKDQINDAAEAVRANAGNAFEGLRNNAGLLKDRLFNLDLEGVGQSFKGIAANIKGISFKEVQSGISALGSGLASIGKALLTNPLFLLAAAIGAAVAYSDELLSLVDGISAADEKQLNAQKEKAALATQQLDSISAQEEILKEQGKTEEEITDMKQQALDVAIKEQEVVIATQKSQLVAQVQAAERNRQILNGVLQFLTAPLQLLLGAVDGIIKGLNSVGAISDETYKSIGSLRENLNNSITGLLFDPAQVQKDGEAAIKESEAQLLKLQNQAAGFRNKERDAAKRAAQQAAEDQKKLDDKKAEEDRKKQEQAEYEAQFLAQLELEQEEQLAQNKLDLEKRLQDAKLLLQQDAIAKQKALDDFELQSMQEGIDKELAMLAAKYDAEILAAEGNAELQKAITQKYQDDVNAINEDAAKKAIELERAKEDAKLELASQGLNVLGDLTALFGKKNEASAKRSFQIQKGLSIAQAVVDTYKGANAIFASAAANPATILFPGQPFIAAGLAIAAGIANVAKIASQKFEGGGAQGGGGGGVPSLGGGGGGGGNVGTVPTFNAMNLGFLQNRPEQTPKAYVLAQDVSSAVEARDKVRDLARIN